MDLTANPRVTGTDNDLAEDCQALVAAQNHWAATTANSNLASTHPLRTWGTGTATKISNWQGIAVADKRVSSFLLAGYFQSRISGTIPTQLASLTKLRILVLKGNQLTGSIPTQLQSLTNIETLELAGNQLTGSIPTQLSSLTKVSLLSLNNNRLTGSIPTQLASLNALTSLYLQDNLLSGSIPTQLGSLATPSGALANFEICDNYLTGAVPAPLRSILLNYPSVNGYDPVSCQSTSNITFTQPSGLILGINRSKTFDVSNYAVDGEYTISCGDPTAIDAKITIVRSNCDYTISPQGMRGESRFTVPYSSTGGDTQNGTIPITVGPPSTIVFTAPSNLSIEAGSSTTVNAASYATDGIYTITCADATSVSSKFSSITRTAGTCDYTLAAKATAAGPASFIVPYTSSGGDTLSGTIFITIISVVEPVEDEPQYDTPYPFFLPPAPEPKGSLRWNFYTVQQNGTSPEDISLRLAEPAYPYIWTWNTTTQAWQRIPLTSSSLPAGALVVFRTTQEPNPDTLADLNLGATIRTTVLQQGWNILSVPADLTRPSAETFLIDDLLLRCDTDTRVEIIANYQTTEEAWYIWLPCYPRTETHYTTGPEAMYKPLAQIAQTQPIYLCLTSPTPIAIAWNPSTQIYEIQNQIISSQNPETNPTTHTCSK